MHSFMRRLGKYTLKSRLNKKVFHLKEIDFSALQQDLQQRVSARWNFIDEKRLHFGKHNGVTTKKAKNMKPLSF